MEKTVSAYMPVFHVMQRDTHFMKCTLPLFQAKKVAYQDKQTFFDLDTHIELPYTARICRGCLTRCPAVVSSVLE